MSKVLRYKDYDCEVEFGNYNANNQIAISLIASSTEHNQKQDVFSGETIARATVCIPDVLLTEKETIVKDFSENEGMLNFLLNAGIIKKVGRSVRCGFEVAHIVEVF